MIAKKTCAEVWPLILIYLVVMELILLPAIYYWPDVYDFSLKSSIPIRLPDFGQRILDAISDSNSDVAYRHYFAIQVFIKGANICGMAMATVLGTCFIARERENQTLEFLLARPVSRARIMFAKCWVMEVGLVVPIFLVAWSGKPLSMWMLEEDLPLWPITAGAIHSSLFVTVFFMITCLCSVLFRTQTHTAATAGVFAVLQATLYLIPNIRSASMFKLADLDVYGPMIMGNTPDFIGNMQISMAVGAVLLYLITAAVFRRINL